MINNLVSFNKLAMENLTQNKLEMAYHFMHRAEKVLSSLPESLEKDSLTLITCNNQACLYKALGQSYQSLQFLYKATTINPNTPEDYFNLARCNLNLSLLKAEEKDTDSALTHSMKALDLLSNHCEEDVENYYENLCTAFNIIASQHKIKGNEAESQRVYKRGFEISSKFLGNSHPITQNIGKHVEQRKLRFVKKPKTSGITLPKMLNRAWPQAYSSNKHKEQQARATSLDFRYEPKPTKGKRVFTKEPAVFSGKPSMSSSLEGAIRRTQENFLSTSSQKAKKTPKNKLLNSETPVILIQTAFRRFLAKERLEEIRDSKLTRRQLAEKRAILALHEFELLKDLAFKENPYYEASDKRSSAKVQSRRGTAKK